jgi:hypothetical protein
VAGGFKVEKMPPECAHNATMRELLLACLFLCLALLIRKGHTEAGGSDRFHAMKFCSIHCGLLGLARSSLYCLTCPFFSLAFCFSEAIRWPQGKESVWPPPSPGFQPVPTRRSKEGVHYRSSPDWQRVHLSSPPPSFHTSPRLIHL